MIYFWNVKPKYKVSFFPITSKKMQSIFLINRSILSFFTDISLFIEQRLTSKRCFFPIFYREEQRFYLQKNIRSAISYMNI